MSEARTPLSASRMNGIAWSLFLALVVLFLAGRESAYAGPVLILLAIGLAWFAAGCGIATIFAALRAKSGPRHILIATPVVLISGLFAAAWTYDFARMLLGYGD